MSRHGILGIRRWGEAGDVEGISFWCHGCQCAHSVSVQGGDPGQNWQFNGDYDKPVLSPSIRVYTPARTSMVDGQPVQVPERTLCHSFVGCNGAQPGEIIYLGDSSVHQLRGAHALQPWPDSYGFAGEEA